MRFIYTKTFVRIFAIFVLLACLVVLDAKGYLGRFKDGFFRVYGFGVTKLTLATNGVKQSFVMVFTIKNLAKENATLSSKVDQLSFENARLKSASDENSSLRHLLNFQQQSSLKLIPLDILSVDPTGFTQTIVVNKGADFNLHSNQAVVVDPGLLVGKITKVYPNSSEVTLVTDPAVVIAGEVVDSGARGLIRGEHGLGLSLDLVTQNELIKAGDAVITSGLAGDFPRGLLIGNVSEIRTSNKDLFQKAFVAPAADLRNLRFIFAIQ